MEVSIFKNVFSSSQPFQKSIEYCLDRIRNDRNKAIVDKVRQGDKKAKEQLPGVCFNGTFSNRSAAGLIQRSGLIVLDFDKFETEEEAAMFKDSILDDEYIFAAWISPSYKGEKVLVQIETEGPHKGYFDALKTYFKSDNWDDSGSDISRFCFESYDPDLYHNPNSKIWTEYEAPDIEEVGSYTVIVPVTSDNQKIKRLFTWWNKKYGHIKGDRNNNLFKLASAFNDFGVSQNECESELKQFEESDFTATEIQTLIKSAYKKTSQFGTKFFENHTAVQKLEKQIRSGKKEQDLKRLNPEIPKEIIIDVIEKVKEDLAITDFWYYNDKGNIQLSPYKYKHWIQQNNFFKYFPSDSQTFTFIRIETNIVEETNTDRIKDFVLKYLEHKEDIGIKPFEFMSNNVRYFMPNFLSFLDSKEIELREDTKEEAYLFYKNCVVRITQNKREIIDYIDLDGYVWRNQIINREYTESDHHDSEFRTFVWRISGDDIDRYNSFKSVIGYLLHSFKTSAHNKAIIFNDEEISDNPDGRSGKGLLSSAISKMKEVAILDGKIFDQNKSFPYQTVSTSTQVLVFDDLKKNFNFENQFSLITEGITLEYKGQDAIKVPVEKSPKIVMSTNYTIGGNGGSHEARKFEIELSNYFNVNYTPQEEFGHMLFDDWDKAEWARFDSFMMNCLQYYLEFGLVAQVHKNLEERKFIKNTRSEFHEWCQDDDSLGVNIRIDRSQAFDNFVKDYPDLQQGTFKLTQRKFKMYLQEYAKWKGYKYQEGRTNSMRWSMFTDENFIDIPPPPTYLPFDNNDENPF